MKGLATTTLLLVVSACVAITGTLAQEPAGPAEQIEPGMSTAEVLDILGPPDAAQPAILGAGGPSESIWEYALDANTAGAGERGRLKIIFEGGEVREVSDPARDADSE